jgi:hypothetical protein
MIIDRSYFTGPLVIPQLGSIPVQDTVDAYITMYEPELLSKVMGESLANALNQAIEDLGSDEDLDQRWKDILDGVSFTNSSSRPSKWVGLAPVNQIPGGPIAAFVWFHYTRDTAAQNSGVGVVSATAENAVNVSPTFKLSQAWNSMVKDVRVLWQFLNVNTAVYPEWVSSEVCGSYFGTINAFGI